MKKTKISPENNNVFASRLKELINEKSLINEDIAKAVGVTRQGVGNWVNGATVPDVLTAAKLADFFGVSLDYLAGKTSVRSIEADLKAVCDYTGLDERAVISLRQINVRPPKNEYSRQFPKITKECYKQCIDLFIVGYLDEFLTDLLDCEIEMFYFDKELKQLNKQLDDEMDGITPFSGSASEKIDIIEEKADFCRYQTERSIRKTIKLYLEQVNWGFMLINGHKQLLEILEQGNVEEVSDNGEH